MANALRRIETAHFLAMSSITTKWVDDLRAFYQTTPGQLLVTKLLDNNTDNQFQLRDGLLYHQNRLFIPNNTTVRHQLLEEYHSTTLGGHFGMAATIRRIATTFQWPKLKDDVQLYSTMQSLSRNQIPHSQTLWSASAHSRSFPSMDRYIYGFHYPPSNIMG